MAHKIKAVVKYRLQTAEEEIVDLPGDWDSWSDDERQDYLDHCAMMLQHTVAPCHAEVIEVPE